MSAERIADRYAKSLLELAQERGEMQSVLGDIEHFNKSLENRDLQLLLKSPIVPSSKKLAILDRLFSHYQELTRSFLRLVTQKKREEALPAIGQEFMRQYRKLQGISIVRLTSAQPLEGQIIDQIKQELIESGITTSTIELEQVIDPDLIGGFVLQAGDRLYDASTSNVLRELGKTFTGNLYQRNIR